mgnify:CR=1 FL=1
MTTKTAAVWREEARQGGYNDHSGLCSKKRHRQQSIVTNPGGRRTTRDPVNAERQAVLERRRRLEQHAEDAVLAEATGEIWDESS